MFSVDFSRENIFLLLKQLTYASYANAGHIASDEDALGDQTFQKITLLRDKISRNVAALPIVLKRLRECMSNIDKLDSQNTFIHPAIKRKRTS